MTQTPALDANDAKDRLIVALDVPSAAEARACLVCLGSSCRWVKVGMELYYAEGNAFVQELRGLGYEVFLDLKLHDIPNTVAGAVRSATRAGASLLTVHAGGGAAMMAAAVEAATARGSPRMLAVTVLTSMDAVQLTSVGVAGSPAEQVLRLAQLAWDAGIRGLVCSAEEVALLRSWWFRGSVRRVRRSVTRSGSPRQRKRSDGEPRGWWWDGRSQSRYTRMP